MLYDAGGGGGDKLEMLSHQSADPPSHSHSYLSLCSIFVAFLPSFHFPPLLAASISCQDQNANIKTNVRCFCISS